MDGPGASFVFVQRTFPFDMRVSTDDRAISDTVESAKGRLGAGRNDVGLYTWFVLYLCSRGFY